MIKRLSATLLAGMVFLFAVILPISAVASAEGKGYSDVLNDLCLDEEFHAEEYPERSNDPSLSVIQIAESTEGELFVYVYRPSAPFRGDLTATTVRFSTGINDNAKWSDYDLTLLSTHGVFDKYLVAGFAVKEDALRYYDIAAIHRRWVKGVDEPPTGSGQVIGEVSFEVAKLYTASTVGGSVTYTCTQTEAIEITDKVAGRLRYTNGFKLFLSQCDSHYVAFSTDRPIEKLMEADVFYTSVHSSWSMDMNGEHYLLGEPEEHIAELSYTDVASNPGDGLWGRKYTWDRIERVQDFIAKEDLTDAAKNDLRGKEWVLRFTETDYVIIYGVGFVEDSTIVSNISILRLKFETAGKVYNLGVVDNKQTGSSDPGNNDRNDLDFSNWDIDGSSAWWKWAVAILALILLVVLLWPILPLVAQALVWIIMLPFKAIASLCKAISNSVKKRRKKEEKEEQAEKPPET